MDWHKTGFPEDDKEVVARVKGLRFAEHLIVKHTSEGWWQYMRLFTKGEWICGWVGLDVDIIAWSEISE